MADLHAVDLGQVGLDVADRHPAPVHRDDLLVEAVKTPLVLLDDLRLKRAGAVARRLDAHRPMLRVQRLRCRAVARVADAAGRRATALVAEVTGQLGVHRPLDQPLGQRLQQTALARDLSGRAGAGE